MREKTCKILHQDSRTFDRLTFPDFSPPKFSHCHDHNRSKKTCRKLFESHEAVCAFVPPLSPLPPPGYGGQKLRTVKSCNCQVKFFLPLTDKHWKHSFKSFTRQFQFHWKLLPSNTYKVYNTFLCFERTYIFCPVKDLLLLRSSYRLRSRDFSHKKLIRKINLWSADLYLKHSWTSKRKPPLFSIQK